MAGVVDAETGERVRASFRGQVEACRRLGSPFTALFCADYHGRWVEWRWSPFRSARIASCSEKTVSIPK